LQQWYKEYIADFLCYGQIPVEIKAMSRLSGIEEAQLINYLKATNIEVGLLLNFGKRPEIRRKIFTNDRKARNRA